MQAEDLTRVRHMIEAAESAMRFVKGRSRSDLDGDEMLRFALTRAIDILGEAASKVSPEGRASIPEVPWVDVVGMRNKLIHAYFDRRPRTTPKSPACWHRTRSDRRGLSAFTRNRPLTRR